MYGLPEVFVNCLYEYKGALGASSGHLHLVIGNGSAFDVGTLKSSVRLRPEGHNPLNPVPVRVVDVVEPVVLDHHAVLRIAHRSVLIDVRLAAGVLDGFLNRIIM